MTDNTDHRLNQTERLTVELGDRFGKVLSQLFGKYGYSPLWIIAIHNDGTLYVGLSPDLDDDPQYSELVAQSTQDLVAEITIRRFMRGGR